MTYQRQALGRLGEDVAANYLEKCGLKIITRNYRCRAGEIDIVAMDRRVLVFVEVRSRRGGDFGLPQESIIWRKRAKVRQVATYYVKSQGLGEVDTRFDVVAIRFGPNDRIVALEYIKNAF